MMKFSLVFLLFLFSLPGSLPAATNNVPGDYLTDVWTSENGLPDNSVTAIAQTPDGYLWLGTDNGLARFDGVRFVTFDPANTPALQHAHVRRLYVDSCGTLWINTYDGSLTTYCHGHFVLERQNTQLSEGELTPVSSSSNEVIFLMTRGELLRKSLAAPPLQGWDELSPPHRGLGAICCEDGKGTIWYRDENRWLWRVTHWRFALTAETNDLIRTNVNSLTTDSVGRMWAGTDNGLVFWDGRKFQNSTPSNAPQSLKVTFVSGAVHGRIWVIANDEIGVAIGRQWQFAPNASRRTTDEPSPLLAQEDHAGGLWLSYRRGLIHVSPTGLIHHFSAKEGFPGERVYCSFLDREGNIWAGFDASGLARVRMARFHSVDPGNQRPAKTVCEDFSGAVWIGWAGRGLERWPDGWGTNIAAPDSGAMDSVFCVCEGPNGHWWASAGDEDLYYGTPSHWTRVTPVIHGVKVILAAGSHPGSKLSSKIWVGTSSGLYVGDGDPTGFRLFGGMAHHSVRALTEDKAGTLWAGSGNGDLYCIADDKVAAYRPNDSREVGAIWSVLADDDGTVWAGTFRGGLLRFHGGAFVRYGKAQGLPDDVICQILEDDHGNLWLGSHQGIFRVEKSALDAIASGKDRSVTCVEYGRSDGLPSLECSGGYQPSAMRGHDGKLWFTTARGIGWIQPREIHLNPMPPPVVIEEVSVDGETQTNFPDGGKPSSFVIPPGKHQIEIHYTGLSLVSPERVQFRYRLEGVNAEWTDAGARRFAQFSYLPPGKYLFHVLACNSDGVWNESGAVLAFQILPEFYQAWWFQAVSVAVVLAVVAAIVRQLVTRRLHLKMERLERRQAVERERARIARDIHDDLGATLTLIAVLGDLAQKEKTAERIEKISNSARNAVKSLDEIVWAVNPRNDTLSHLLDYLCQFASDYLREAGIRCFLETPEQVPAREVPAMARHNIFLVVREALQNIVKHAGATEVRLRIHAGGDCLEISVQDNGCGFEGEPVNAWADGLRNMRQRLAEVNGTCRIQSRLRAGTTISLSLRLLSDGLKSDTSVQ